MKPRSQVEEMPPFVLPSHTLSPLQSYSSTRHPVFFTDSFRRPPFPLPPDASRGQSPIAHGYIYEPKRPVQAGNGQTKL
ncbi:hypothetical protein M501DRAFT_935448 [Patellaria atrata CBS 101060]|uniref:Uncharacterized protein n=1 Tax=Patellaria atrata CBS 101060 TaxID=1346257 RepID=A0A9P4VMI7_9PEZI|nr:hypothetical protein M501DRAFT_935448 [Patellaria atrata CBS 101060]